MKKKKSLDFLKEFENGENTPLYYFSLEERAKQKNYHAAYSKYEKGYFFVPDSFYKPISLITKRKNE